MAAKGIIITDLGGKTHLQRDANGDTELHRIGRYKDGGERLKKFLTEHPGAKAFLNCLNSQGNTPLQCAILAPVTQITRDALEENIEYVDNVTALLNARADPNLRTGENGFTALHTACNAAKPGIVEVLLQGGADCTIRNKANHTPLECARARCNEFLQTRHPKRRARYEQIIKRLDKPMEPPVPTVAKAKIPEIPTAPTAPPTLKPDVKVLPDPKTGGPASETISHVPSLLGVDESLS